MNPNQQIINQSIPIPEQKIGWMIGKSGSYLNQLCLKSGASITISESSSKEYGRVWKYIQLKGTGRAVDKAKKLIHIRLERLEPRAEDGEHIPVDADILSGMDATGVRGYAAGVGGYTGDEYNASYVPVSHNSRNFSTTGVQIGGAMPVTLPPEATVDVAPVIEDTVPDGP